MSEHDRIEALAEALRACLAELDALSIDVAAAHVSAALQVLATARCRQPHGAEHSTSE